MRWPVSGRGSTLLAYAGGMATVTQLLSAIERGDPHAAAELMPLVCDEVRKLAAIHPDGPLPNRESTCTGRPIGIALSYSLFP